jgi:hypothetical protein
MNTKRETFFYIHNHKTGGVTFRAEILKNNFGQKLKSEYPAPSYYYYYSKEAVEWTLRTLCYTCYASHSYRLSSIPKLADHKIYAISFTREPIDIFLSTYFHFRSKDTISPWHPTKKMLLKEFLHRFLNDRSFNRLPLYVSQEEFICGDLHMGQPSDIIKQPFGVFHLFPLERFDDAMICLEALYPAYFKDCSYAMRLNKLFRDQKIDTEIIKMIEQLPWIERDRELHKFSQQYLDRLLEGLFPGKETLERARSDFRKRCEDRKEAFGKTTAKMPIEKRLKRAARILIRGY